MSNFGFENSSGFVPALIRSPANGRKLRVRVINNDDDKAAVILTVQRSNGKYLYLGDPLPSNMTVTHYKYVD